MLSPLVFGVLFRAPLVKADEAKGGRGVDAGECDRRPAPVGYAEGDHRRLVRVPVEDREGRRPMDGPLDADGCRGWGVRRNDTREPSSSTEARVMRAGVVPLKGGGGGSCRTTASKSVVVNMSSSYVIRVRVDLCFS